MDYCDNPISAEICDSFYLTAAATTTTRVMSCLVGLVSLFVMVVIYRSPTKLSSVYHRIMFGMASMDLLASIAMSLSTIPMPADQIYPFASESFGTVRTCEAQAFVFLLGNYGSKLYFVG